MKIKQKEEKKRRFWTPENVGPGPLMVYKARTEEDYKQVAEWVAKVKAKEEVKKAVKSLTKSK